MKVKKYDNYIKENVDDSITVVALFDENSNLTGVVSDFNNIEIVTSVLEKEFQEPIIVEYEEGYNLYHVTSPTNNFDKYTIHGESTNFA